MTKVMVVEDDAALREIYSIRITAEGYEVVSAGDGEEALAMAVREKPDLILSDVMMPKISGFDMLDILRTTPETSKIKIVMMTALSADDQRDRGEKLGADRYLVKSQVGIEDMVNAIHEVLGDRATNAQEATQPQEAQASAPAQPQPQPASPFHQPSPFAVPPAAQAFAQATPPQPPVPQQPASQVNHGTPNPAQ